jgi:hypothetical protein
MTFLTRLGVLEIAFSAVFLPLFLKESIGGRFMKDRRQLLQSHLDYFFMGILLILAGSVLQPLPLWIEFPLIFGSLGNPTVFLINSLKPDLPENIWYRLFILLSCAAVAFAWAALALKMLL